MLLPHSKMGL
jgi:hypothetical protein